MVRVAGNLVTDDRLRHAAPILAGPVDRGELLVVGGVYDLATGKVELV